MLDQLSNSGNNDYKSVRNQHPSIFHHVADSPTTISEYLSPRLVGFGQRINK